MLYKFLYTGFYKLLSSLYKTGVMDTKMLYIHITDFYINLQTVPFSKVTQIHTTNGIYFRT